MNISRITQVFIVLLFCLSEIFYLNSHYKILINYTESLPNFAFLIKKTELQPGKGQYVAFKPKYTRYHKDKIFVKQVAGVNGDKISNRLNPKKKGYTDIYIDDKYLCTAKPRSLVGDVLKPNTFAGQIEKEHYFLVAPHKDSYDSRYEDIGLIKQEDILGVAIPIL
ncbi:S26 family signal peptidase [Pseudomonadota bacterium]